MSARNIVFVAAQNGTEPHTGRTLRNIESQARQCLENIVHALEPTTLGKESIAKCTIYMTHLKDLNVVETVYHSFFQGLPIPPRTVVGVKDLPKSNDNTVLITIEAVAIEQY